MSTKNKKELFDKLKEVQRYNLLLEVSNAELRLRNGELLAWIEESPGPSHEVLTPTAVTYGRFNRIYDLVEATIKWSTLPEMRLDAQQEKLSDIRERALGIRNFIQDYWENRPMLSDGQIEKMQAGRKRIV